MLAHTRLSSPACKGQQRITVKDQSCFHIGCFIVIGEIFAVTVVDKGSLVLEEPLPRDFPTGTHVKQFSQNEPTSSIENGFGHRIVKAPASEELSSDSGGGVACLLENEVILPTELQRGYVVTGLQEQHCKFLSL